MVGIDVDHAHPTMVIVSEDKGYRYEAQRLMKKMRVLKDTGFRVMTLESRIDRDAGDPTIPEDSSLGDAAVDDLANILVGARVSSVSAQATIGGQVVIDGQEFGVTVAHLFRPSSRNSSPEPLDVDFDNDGFSDSSENSEISPNNEEWKSKYFLRYGM
jgi:hypothetical protein